MSVTSRAQLRLDGEPRSALCGMPHKAERDLRPWKTVQKISGRLQSSTATRHRLTIRGYISTAIKHGLDAMTVLRDAILGTPWMPPIPMII